jgi:Fibronectin type III domain
MAKRLLNLYGTILFTAALTVLSGAGRAQDIASGMLCSKKVAANSWYVCGAVPFKKDGTIYEGPITYEGAGSHEVTVFITGAIGIQGAVEGVPVAEYSPLELSEHGIKQIQRSLRPDDVGKIEVSTGDLVYVARRDHMLTDRTVGVLFLDVPGDLGDAPAASDARIRIELNSTTGDAGVRASVDGEGESLSSVRIVGPNQRIFQGSGGNLGQLGLAELAFETHAPALEELLALFPEGEYRLQGRTVEGDKIVHTASLTHDIPDGPAILTPEEGAVVDPEDAVISWDPVTEPAGVEIARYRVIVERGDRGRSLSLDLPPETTDVLVPPDFLEPGTDYLFKVLAIEAGGNQTISQGVFDTAGDDPGAAEDIKVGDVCQKKIEGLSWHLCGAAPADGQIYYGNDGSHELDVFTTGPAGLPCPPGTNGLPITKSKSGCDILQIGQPRPLQTFEWGSIKVSAGDLIYIARPDRLLSDRTLAIKFCAGPGCG